MNYNVSPNGLRRRSLYEKRGSKLKHVPGPTLTLPSLKMRPRTECRFYAIKNYVFRKCLAAKL
jgi:hypothetical protein